MFTQNEYERTWRLTTEGMELSRKSQNDNISESTVLSCVYLLTRVMKVRLNPEVMLNTIPSQAFCA